MKFKRIVTTALITALAAVSFAGCGTSDTSSGNAQDTPPANADTSSGETTPSNIDYPGNKDITVIIPKGAGGGTDISTRGALQFLGKYIEGANFVPVNKPDGGGVTGMVETAHAKADGYTLGALTVELGMFPHQDKSPVNYEDFAPIFAQIASPAALIVPGDAPYDTVDEFVAYAKDHPNELMVGNSGMGAIWHIAAISFEDEFDVEFKHIPYPNGTADIVAALAGGHIDATFADPAGVRGQYEAGDVKILGTMAAERSLIYPDVPTFREMGYDMTIRAWAVIAAPKDTPEEILTILRDAAAQAAADPEFQEYLMNQGIDPVNIVGEECFEMMKQDHAMFEEMLAKVETNE